MTNKQNLICLCPRCRQNFLAAHLYSLRRVQFPQEKKDTCTYCQTRYGYDYYVEPLPRAATL